MPHDLAIVWYSLCSEVDVPSDAINAFTQRLINTLGLANTSDDTALLDHIYATPHAVGIQALGQGVVLAHAGLVKLSRPSSAGSEIPIFPEYNTFFYNRNFNTTQAVLAHWDGGKIRRSFSADIFEIFENIGLPVPVEKPFWAGAHPLVFAPGVNPVRTELPFHPIKLATELFAGGTQIPSDSLEGQLKALVTTPFTLYYKTE